MSRGINKVILIGNLGADPEVRATQGGNTVTTLSIATSESWRDRNSGEQTEKTEWHRVVAFNRQADILAEYVRKGSKLYVEGKLQTRKWQDQSGQDRYTTEVIVRDFAMLDGRNNSSNRQQTSQSAHSSQSNRMQDTPDDDPFGDDIPF